MPIETFKTLLREIRDLNKWTDYTTLIDWKIQHCYMAILPILKFNFKMKFKFSAIIIHIPTSNSKIYIKRK